MSAPTTISQAYQAGPVMYSYVPQPTNTVASNVPSSASQSSLGTGWVLAIVTLILFTMSLSINLWYWRKSRRTGASVGYSTYSEPREYEMQRPRPARVRHSMFGGGRGYV